MGWKNRGIYKLIMFNFTLKDLYDDKIGGYLFLVDLFKWASIVLVIVGAFLAIWFNDYILAILGGLLLCFIGFIAAIIAHFIRKKLAIVVAKGGSLVEGTENYLKDQAKQQFHKFRNKHDKTTATTAPSNDDQPN